MSDSTKTYTEKEVVLRERAAYLRGVDALYICGEVPATMPMVNALERTRGRAGSIYPLPKVERPRVVRDSAGIAFRVGKRDSDQRWVLFVAMNEGDEWRAAEHLRYSLCIDEERATIIADLFANPTELVEA